MPSKRISSRPSATVRKPSSGKAVPILPAVLLLIVTLAVFLQTARFDFLNFDDDAYVTANPWVRAGLTAQGVKWAFTTLHESNWHPLTWLSLMLDAQIAGVRPGFFHVTNVLLHLIGAWLLLHLLWRSTGLVWRSAFVAALFAVHPLHVESVAWVSERKDVLSTVFWMLTMIWYSRYAGTGSTRSTLAYVLSITSLGLGLMGKPMLVTVPLILLLWDYWPLARIGTGAASTKIERVVIEKVPFLALSLASGTMTLVAQRLGGAMGTTTRYPIGARIGNAVVSYATYLGKTVVPTRMAIYYPHPLHAPPWWQIAGSLLILSGITALVVGPLRQRRYLLVGWLWYLITLLPVVGLIQVGGQAMADRYTYVPLIGLFLMVAWGVPDLVGALLDQRPDRGRYAPSRRSSAENLAQNGARRRKGAPSAPADAGTGPLRGDAPAPPAKHPASKALFACGVLVVVALGVCAYAQTRHFRDSVSVFEHALSSTKNNFVAHGNLGTALFDRGELDAALSHLEEAVRIEPGYPDARNNLAGALLKQGKIEEARVHCREILRRWPDHPRALTNLALAAMIEGNLPEASKHLTRALQIDPGFNDARLNLGVVLKAEGKLDEAIAQFREVLRLDPYDQDARHSLEMALEAKRSRPS